MSQFARRQFFKQSGHGIGATLAVMVVSNSGLAQAIGQVQPEQHDPLFELAVQLTARAATALNISGGINALRGTSAQNTENSNVVDLLRSGLRCELAARCSNVLSWSEAFTHQQHAPGLFAALITNQDSGAQIRLEIDSVVLSHLSLLDGNNVHNLCDQMLQAGACRLQWIS
jgi:hypothetical protein